MSRLVRIQLIVFVVVALLGIVYVGARYVRLDRMLGLGHFVVTVTMSESGGLHTNSEVTYRGVPVGRVGSVRLTASGVETEVQIDSGSPAIPASARAYVSNRSAIGEQYLDLRPDSGDGPYLRAGSRIDGAAVPIPVQELITQVDSLARSVDLAALHTTVVELGTAFNGKGDDLAVLTDALLKFTETGVASLPDVIALIRDGNIVLGTQAAQSGAITRFSEGLNQLTAQLRSSDPDIRRLIGTGTVAGNSVNQLLATSGGPLTVTLGNLRAVAMAVAPKSYALKPLLQGLPLLAGGGTADAPGDGTTHFGLVFETNNPPACTRGYEGTQVILAEMKRRNPDFDDTRDDFPFNTKATCTVPQGNPTAVRGAQRAELADPAIRQPWDSRPKTDPDKLNMAPAAIQLAALLGIYRR